jgi:hypothetical protein
VRSVTPLPPTDSGRGSGLRSRIPLPVRVFTASPSQEASSVGKGRKSPVALRVVSKTVGAAAGSNKASLSPPSRPNKASLSPPSRPSPLNNRGKGKAAGVAARRSADPVSSVQATRAAEESSEAKPKGILKKSLRFAYRKVSNNRIAFCPVLTNMLPGNQRQARVLGTGLLCPTIQPARADATAIPRLHCDPPRTGSAKGPSQALC